LIARDWVFEAYVAANISIGLPCQGKQLVRVCSEKNLS